MNGAQMEAVTQRLNGLERENRWWKLIGCAVAALFGVVLLMGATGGRGKGVAEEIRAGRFIVVDEHGKPRVVMGSTPLGPAITLLDENGKVRAGLELGPLGPRIILNDSDGRNRLMMVISPKGPIISLQDRKGKVRVALGELPG